VDTHKPTASEISELASFIATQEAVLASKKVTAGFDGFIDTIVKVIKSKEADSPPDFFGTTTGFGKYITEKGGSSFGLELEQRNIKLGGNMPIMGHALGTLGARVNCIGALGYPQINSVFNTMSSNCQLYTFAEPGTCTAFEFDDGKIMFAQMGDLNSFGWKNLKDTIGIDVLKKLYGSSDLLGIVNWSEIDVSSDIWRGLLTDVFPLSPAPLTKPITFFDLADCSKRSVDAITEALNLIQTFARHTRVTLGLNKNETICIHKILFPGSTEKEIIDMGAAIFEKMDINLLLLHAPKYAMAIDREGTYHLDTFYISHPKLSTGAGDHFNAGFSAARLLNANVRSSLILANAVSAIYVKTGVSPRLKDVSNFLLAHKDF
jgi:hypothetical protein